MGIVFGGEVRMEILMEGEQFTEIFAIVETVWERWYLECNEMLTSYVSGQFVLFLVCFAVVYMY